MIQGMEGKYLKNQQYYSDLYDRHTVERCRVTLASLDKIDKKFKDEKKQREYEAVKKTVDDLMFHFETGERYINKDKTIREWMDRDQKRDEFYENAEPPEDIRCLTCRNRMRPADKHLWIGFDKPDRVMFIYDCVNQCPPRRSFFDNGEEYRSKPDLCPKCTNPLTLSSNNDANNLLIIHTCKKCKYTKTDDYSSKKEEPIDENFALDRDKYCLSQAEGWKYIESKSNLEQLGKLLGEIKEEENARLEKLKEHPDGFHLEDRGVTCAICGTHAPAGDNWFDKWGMKCLTCQNGIDKGEVPGSIAKFKDSWYSRYDFERSFNIKTPTLRKWVKEGILKSRIITNYGKGTHYEVYLIKDNKGFLPPKKLVESRGVNEVGDDGKTWFTTRPWYQFGDPHETIKGYKILDYLKFTTESGASNNQASS